MTKAGYRMAGLMQEEVERRWDEIEPALWAALIENKVEDRCDLEAFRRAVRCGQAMVAQVTDGGDPVAWLGLEILPLREGGKSLHVRYLGGSRMRSWLAALHHDLVKCARQLGCDCVSLVGRRGWSRQLHGLGWKVGIVTMEARLNQ